MRIGKTATIINKRAIKTFAALLLSAALLVSLSTPGFPGAQAQVAGGTAAQRYQFPEVVALKGNGSLCTGIVIGPKQILTAQHCVCDGVDKQAMTGLYVDAPDQIVGIATAVPMAPCGSDNRGKDIALLTSDIPINVFAAKFMNPQGGSGINKVRAVGFGNTETGHAGEKFWADISVVSSGCDTSAAGTYNCVPGELVAKDENGIDTCKGDSGGPVFTSVGLRVLIGITSRAVKGTIPGTCGNGGVYEILNGTALIWLQKHGVQPLFGA